MWELAKLLKKCLVQGRTEARITYHSFFAKLAPKPVEASFLKFLQVNGHVRVSSTMSFSHSCRWGNNIWRILSLKKKARVYMQARHSD